MKRNDVEEAAIDEGVKRGELTYEELNELFPAEYFPLEEIERLLIRLDGLGIRLHEREGCRVHKVRHQRRAA